MSQNCALLLFGNSHWKLKIDNLFLPIYGKIMNIKRPKSIDIVSSLKRWCIGNWGILRNRLMDTKKLRLPLAPGLHTFLLASRPIPFYWGGRVLCKLLSPGSCYSQAKNIFWVRDVGVKGPSTFNSQVLEGIGRNGE